MAGIAIHHTATSDAAWDGPGNVAKLRSGESRGYYARMYAWIDPEADDTTKAAYKFPHHVVDGDGNPGAANIRGCQAGIAVLNGSMGGSDIPDADRRSVYNHLAAHLRDGDVEPADLRRADDYERRSLPARELRVVDGGDGEAPTPPRITGYAAVFNSPSDDLGGFREIIRPGAFTKTIQEGDVRGLWNHNPDYVLGRTKSGTLKLLEDEVGLRFELTPPDTQWARDAMTTIRRGDVDQMSFAFRVVRDDWTNADGQTTRYLGEVKLFDISPVTFPAYPQTSAQVRARALEFSGAPAEDGHPPVDDEAAARGRADVLRRRIELAEHEL